MTSYRGDIDNLELEFRPKIPLYHLIKFIKNGRLSGKLPHYPPVELDPKNSTFIIHTCRSLTGFDYGYTGKRVEFWNWKDLKGRDSRKAYPRDPLDPRNIEALDTIGISSDLLRMLRQTSQEAQEGLDIPSSQPSQEESILGNNRIILRKNGKDKDIKEYRLTDEGLEWIPGMKTKFKGTMGYGSSGIILYSDIPTQPQIDDYHNIITIKAPNKTYTFDNMWEHDDLRTPDSNELLNFWNILVDKWRKA
jgi:hypothetical protein